LSAALAGAADGFHNHPALARCFTPAGPFFYPCWCGSQEGADDTAFSSAVCWAMARLQQSSEPAGRRKWAWIVLAVIVVLGGAAATVYRRIGEGRKPSAETATSPDAPKPIAPPAPPAPANPPSKLVVGLPPITIPPVAPANPAAAPQPNSTGDQSKKAQNIPEDKLNAAGAALAAVTRIHRDYEQRLAAASPNDRKRIADEGDTALQQAITDKGLSMDEYKAILDAAQNDPDLRAKLVERAKAAQNQ
jgi:Domain of unknown function (DUF4168)